MKKFLCLICISSITFISCQKEIDDIEDTDTENNGSGNNSASLAGTYNFVSMDASMRSDVIWEQAGPQTKTSTFSDYLSTNNAGKMVITDDEITVTGLSYTASGNLKVYTYQDNVLVDSIEQPFTYDMPVSNSSSKYQLIGADSIYSSGGLVSVSGSSSVSATPSGARYTINGNILKIIAPVNIDTTLNVSGGTYRMVETGTSTTTLQKQ